VQAQKSNRNAPAYSRWVNRPFGRVLAATAYKVGLTPNVISTVSACFSYGALVLLALSSPSIALGLSVGLLLVVGYALDSADGQVARLSGGGSLAGEWLDHMFDAAKTTGFHLAVLVFWVRNLGDWPLWTALVPLAFVLQASVWFFGIILTDLLMRNAGQKKQALAVEEGRQGSLVSFLGIPADYGVLCLLMLLIGWFEGWRVLYAGLAAVNVGILSLQLVRWYRRVRSV
jgi:phosphatidylglycerophosphate synthase